ncbi:MAG: beta strand repeat-containing protein, partial [Bacteroidota bacterium]
AAIGLAIGLNIVDDITTSGTGRSITATNGGVSFGAFSYAATGATGTASAAGGADKSQTTEQTTDEQVGSQLDGASNISGNSKASSKKSKTNGKAQTGGGKSVSVAGGIALNLVSSIANAYVADNLTINAAGVLAVQSSNETDASAIADGSATGGAPSFGVGVAVALNIVDITNTGTVGNNATINAKGVTLSALTNKSLGNDGYSNFTVKATSGASSGDVGVAGSLALNLIGTNQSLATVKSGTVNAGGGDVTITAENNTKASTIAEAAQTASGDASKFGLGLSAAIDITDNSAIANITDGLTLTNANKLTLKASSDNSNNTSAKAGAGGGKVAIGGALALNLVSNTTTATIGTGGGLTVGSVDASATHKGNSSADADGRVTSAGTAAIGLAIGLNIVDDITTSGTGRSITATNGGVSFGAFSYAATGATGTASAAGGADKSQTKEQTTDEQVGSQLSGTDSITGSTKGSSKTSKTSGKAKTSSGSVSVAGGIALNLVSSVANAYVADNLTINAAGALAVQSSNETDASAIADGSASSGASGKASVGIAVSLNIVDITNTATVGENATVKVKGLTLSALTNKALGDDGYSNFTSKATSGASDGDVGIAGSFALNLIGTNQSLATVKSGTVDAGGGDVTITAENNTKSITAAAAAQSAAGDKAKFGMGLSAAIDITDNSAIANITDGLTLTNANKLTLKASSDNSNNTSAKAGAGGGKVAIGGALALNLVSNTTTATIVTGGGLTVGSVDASAT